MVRTDQGSPYYDQIEDTLKVRQVNSILNRPRLYESTLIYESTIRLDEAKDVCQGVTSGRLLFLSAPMKKECEAHVCMCIKYFFLNYVHRVIFNINTSDDD